VTVGYKADIIIIIILALDIPVSCKCGSDIMYMWYISNYVHIYNFCVSQV